VKNEEPNRAPRGPAGWTAEITFGEIAGPRPGCFQHFASRGSQLQRKVFKVAMGEKAKSLIAHVSLRDGRLRSLSVRLRARVLDAFGTSRLRDPSCKEKCFKVAMGEKAKSLIVHHVSLRDGWLRSLSVRLRARVLDAFGTSRLGDPSCKEKCFKVTMGEKAKSLIAHHVSLSSAKIHATPWLWLT
jgi:hypothetical protein